MSKNIKWVSLLFFLIILIWIVVKAFRGSTLTKQECEKEKQLDFKGVVEYIEGDRMNPAQKMLFFSNGFKLEQIYTVGLWNEVEIGDSIVKEKGTLNYSIYDGPNFITHRKLLWDRTCK